MATNNNLQNIRLGAPTSIEIENQYPHAALSVQTMEQCHTLTLHDAPDGTRCTDEGAMVTAARLLSQLMHERSISENAEGWSITFDPYAMVDAAVYGGADHPVPMSLTGADGAAVCWAVEGDATPGVSLTPDGVLTLPAGCTDTLRIKAIRWDDREVRAMTTIPVSGWREVADALAEISELLVQYPQLAVVLAERPSLAAVVAEWPQVVHSLVDTGERIWLKGDGQAYINTGYHIKYTDTVEADFVFVSSISQQRVFGGADTYEIYQNGSGNFAANTSPINSSWWTQLSPEVSINSKLNHQLHAVFNDTSHKVCIYENGNLITSAALDLKRATCNETLWLFVRIGNNISNGKIANVRCYGENGENFNFVPFLRNGTAGMLDLVSRQFFPNANTTGSFTIVTEK